MAQSTAEELASYLPQFKRSRAKGLWNLLWRRNRGYINRKFNSIFFDVLEILSLAILADVESLKFLYITWIIFYFSQSVLESLFYTARKIYIHEKQFPGKRTQSYVHLLIISIPLFFIFISFERYADNNMAMSYLLFKAIVLTIQILFSYLNFEAQALTRIYYPPLLNWALLIGCFILIVLVQNLFGPLLSFYLVLIILMLSKLIQDVVIYTKVKSLKASLVWQLKRDKITDQNSLTEFLTLISIEVFLPLSILSLPQQSLNMPNMATIFFVYMIVKLILRPIRSVTLDHWHLGIQDNKILIILTYVLALLVTAMFLFQNKFPFSGIFLGLIYFNLLFIWNTKLADKKVIFLLNGVSLVCASVGAPLALLALLHGGISLILFHIKFKIPNNLKPRQKVKSFDNKFIVTFKEQPRWAKLAQLYPELLWSPISSKRCVIESVHEPIEIQKFILANSFEIKLIEKLDLKLAKKLNLQ
jgi:hypothetical protein